MQREGVSYNSVTALDGALVLDCRVGGQNLAGTIRFAGCHRSPIVDSVTASLAAEGDANAPPATQVPEATPLPPLPPELSALSVRLEPRIVGVLADGETMAEAERACLEGERRFARQLGWRVVDGGAAPDLVAEFGCTGHVAVARSGSRVTMTVPHDGTPSLVLREGEHVVASVPPGPARYTCESPTADPESDCSRRVSEASAARVASALVASAGLREFVRRR